MTLAMTQAEKRQNATPILKAAILTGKSMADAAALADISINTAARYRRMAEEAEGKAWSDQLDGHIAEGDAPTLQELSDIIGRRLKWLGEQKVECEAADLIAYSDSLVKLAAVYRNLRKLIDAAAAQANDPEILLRGLDGFAQWLRRELAEKRIADTTLVLFHDLYVRYSSDLQSGKFEVRA